MPEKTSPFLSNYVDIDSTHLLICSCALSLPSSSLLFKIPAEVPDVGQKNFIFYAYHIGKRQSSISSLSRMS